MSNYRASAELEAGPSGLERRGRVFGIALFWLLLCYVIGMSSRSILPAVFQAGHTPVGAVDFQRCAREIDGLEKQLRRVASAAVESGDPSAARLELTAWDKRSLRLAGGCGALERTREQLLAMRAGIGRLVDDYERGPLEAHRRVRRALEASGMNHPSPPSQGPN